ncbi:hypothetical protein CH35J_004887 [Colletotrichum higginsianum]|uniref:Glutathione S-transferase C-terminal domain-containing protein n=1 Tax=Colletotrichum higginsianum TaxID=80884 RepID=A0A4T0W9M9_9PEZI|nr:hypothetical protein CH35J_004887 [Colletotrichum higginsianum]
MKPIKIYGYVAGPHPWKVVILLKELGVPYEIEFLTAEEMKVATYIDFHTDQDITSVYEQYGNMARWVLGVVERQLAKTGHPYVVGDMCTYADLMYIPFHFVLPDKLMRNVSDEFEQVSKGKFPQCYEWNTWIVGRESVQQALEEEYRAMDAAGWPR